MPAMKTALALAAASLLLRLAAAAAEEPRVARRRSLLELQRSSVEKAPPFRSAPAAPAELNLKGFCKTPDDKPACTKKPCCCWSTFAADTHPMYPSEAETQSKRLCLNPPKGFRYAPEPGLSYDDGYLATLKKAAMPTYDGRRLCCLRRHEGVQDESQRDLSAAVKTTSTTTVLTTTVGVPEPGQVDPVFTTELVTTSLMNPGDEYETAQMEGAARAHLAAANDLNKALTALNTSAVVIGEVNAKLQTDPNLVRSRQHVAEMRGAISAWAVRRWANLNRLKSGDASAFEGPGVPAAPPGITP